MSDFASCQIEFAALLDRIVEGLGEPEDVARFNELLRTHVEARREYRNYAAMHSLLSWEARERTGLVDFLSTASITASPTPKRTLVLAWLGRAGRLVPGGELTVGAMVLLVVVAAFWGLWQVMLHPRLGGQDLAEGSGIRDQGSENRDLKSETVATITDTADVEWSQDTSSPLSPGGRGAGGEGDAVRAGEPLSIQSGFVELQLKQGTKLRIEGPAEWSIDGDNNATLKRGKLVANVPRQANGFTLDTPSAKIVDHGTEFGVEVDAGGVSQVHVLTGKVDVQHSRQGKPISTPVRLAAGEAIEVSKEEAPMRKIAAVRERFVGASKPATEQAPSSKVGTLLLRDTFHTRLPTGAQPDFGLNADLPSRQTGAAAPAAYRLTAGGPGHAQVNRGREQPDFLAPDSLILFPNEHGPALVSVQVDLSFPPDVELTTTFEPALDDVQSADWLAIGVRGQMARTPDFDPTRSPTGGAVLALRSNGGWFVCVNGEQQIEGKLATSASAEPLGVRLRAVGDQFSAWVDEQPLDLNGTQPGESLTLTGAAAERTNLVTFAGNCTKSPSEKHRGYQGHVVRPFEISEIRSSKAGNGRNRQD